ncbi:MAG: CHAT domain-containing protein [Pyrinomonadaceae bacterium]
MDEEQVELRLLTEAGYSEELEILENELVDQYVEGTLSEDERVRFEQHFLKAPERRDKLAFVTTWGQAIRAHAPALTTSARKPPSVPWYSLQSFYLKAAAATIIAVCVGIGLWLILMRRSAEEPGMEALRAAYKDQRLVEARITSLEYAPLIITRGQDNSKINEVALRQAELQLLNNLNARPDAKAHHDLGRFYLAGVQLDKSIEEFEKALSQAPDDPQIQSDLGAALLADSQRASQNNDPGKAFTLLAQSLQHIDKALQAKPDLLEALYNKALCFQYMKLPKQAKEAWQNYLAYDSQSKWAEEARRNLQLLSEQSFSSETGPQLLDNFLSAFQERDDGRAWQIISRNRDIITGRMIPPKLEYDYVTSRLNGAEESAQHSLRAFIFAGELERTRGGDPYTLELAHYYASSSDLQLRMLAAANENLQQGFKLCLNTQYNFALTHFEEARTSYSKAGDVWEAKLVEYWISYCLTQLDRVADSIDLLRKLVEFCEVRSYKWLHAQTYYWIAVNYSILSEYSSAIEYYRLSFKLADAISDTYQMQKALTELGGEYADLRQQQSSLEFFYKSLSVAFHTGASPRQALRNFTTAASALFAFKYYDAAAAMGNEALQLSAEELNDPSLNYVLHLNLGRIYSKLRRFDDAIYQAELGMQTAQSAQDAVAKRKLMANAQLQLADIRREAGDCDRALGDYNRSIELYEQMEFDVYRYAAYKGRLLCSLTLNDKASIERDLPHLLQVFEHKRAQIREEQNRNSFFDSEQDVYDVAIEYEQKKRNYLQAVGYSESARARSLLDALQSRAHVVETGVRQDVVFSAVSSPSDIENIYQRLPARLHILMFNVLPTKLLFWDISREGIAPFEKEIPAEALEADVRQYVDSLKDSTAGSPQFSRELGKKLYAILLEEVEKNLAPGQQVCIIPDKFLYQLPFVALVSPTTGRFFIEEHAVSYAPSLNVFNRCYEIAGRKSQSQREAVLSIGNPSFDSRVYPQLSNLQAAEREARTIAKIYDNSTLLVGLQADKVSTLAAMPSAEVIHFAGHYLANESAPLRSKMLMAKTDSQVAEDSALHAYEILERRFDATRLIVLSACQTEFDMYFGGEGAVGLSRTFIAAGVPLVVASQWEVESNGTAELMINFHRQRRAGLSTMEALRGAQLNMLRGSDETYRSPYYWAAFLCVGGYAEY